MKDINSSFQAAQWISNYLKHEITAEERILLDEWLKQETWHQELFNYILTEKNLTKDLLELSDTDTETRLSMIQKLIRKNRSPIRRFILPSLYIAASIFLVSCCVYFWHHSGNWSRSPHSVTDVFPGNNKASLKLDNGKTIVLDSTRESIIVQNEGIRYNDASKIITDHFKAQYYELSTPTGGQYQVILSDGSKVWLNAQSKLKYPSKFSKQLREVELEGEGYFKISNKGSSDEANQPFLVKTRGQIICVLGTEFNVSAYADEKQIKTTLVEGAVRITNPLMPLSQQSVTLVPGKQAILEGNTLKVKDVDVNSAIAWKFGLFRFQGTRISELMHYISRWYNIRIKMQGTVGQQKIFGEIYRTYTLSQLLVVLNELEDGKVKFILNKGSDNNYEILVKTNP
ncbi:FecR family protein [bacterium A37T11]|nr:FecR family protein [bacterium A37T11]